MEVTSQFGKVVEVMEINYVEVENFKGYSDPQRIVFGPCGTVTAIIGWNAHGKTTWLEAIIHSFCGFEGLKLISNRAKFVNDSLFRIPMTKKATATVVLDFTEGTAHYNIKREIFSEKITPTNTHERAGESVLIRKREENNFQAEIIKDSQEIKKILAKILPDVFVKYLFFDGEQLEKYTEDELKKKFSESIAGFEQVETINKGEETFREIQTLLSNELKNDTNSELTKLAVRQETVRKVIRELTHMNETLNQEIIVILARIKVLNQKIDEVKGFDELKNERKEKRAQLEEKINKKKQLTLTKVKLFEHAPFLVGKPVIQDFNHRIDIVAKKLNESIGVTTGLISLSLDNGKCFQCGTEFDGNSTQKETLKAQLEQHQYHNWNYHSEIGDIRHKLGQIESDIKHGEEQLKDYIISVTITESEIKALKDRLTAIDIELEVAGEPTSIQYQFEIDKLEKDKDKNFENIAKNNSTISLKEMELKEIEQKIKDQTELKKGLDEIRNLYNLVVEAEKAYKEAYKTSKEALRTKIAEDTKRSFLPILSGRDKERFGSIEITENFELITRDTATGLDDSTLSSMSAGQFQMLLFYFAQTTFNILEEDSMDIILPSFMDSALNRLDFRNRNFILNHMKESARQLIVFVQPSEYTAKEHALMKINGKLSKLYLLQKQADDNQNEIFRVVPIADPGSYDPDLELVEEGIV
jgi:hypothetical protein